MNWIVNYLDSVRDVTVEGGALLDCTMHYNEPGYETSCLETLPEAAWFAIQTKPRHEKSVAADLETKGITSCVPLYSVKKRWSDRYQMVELPVFANYVFVRVPSAREARVAVLRTQGVVRFIGARGAGTPIPQEEIETVQNIVRHRIACAPYPFLNIGQSVRICGGSLDGVQGILLAQNDDQSLVVSISIIQRSLAIRVAGYRLEPCAPFSNPPAFGEPRLRASF
jgi:transcription antitermination factor NusG